MTRWHEADDFWDILGPVFFESGRWESAPGEVDSLIALLGLAAGSPVLDLCCGPGRRSLELARRGYRVTGVDRTASFLKIARGEAAGLDVEFVQDDMRRFCRPDTYAGVLNLYSSFGYFEDAEDDRLALVNMYRSLMPGGILLLGMVGKEIIAWTLAGRNWIEWEGGFLLESSQVTQDWGWLQNCWVVITKDGIRDFFWGHRLYAASELSGLLAGVGFQDIRLYGDLAKSLYDPAAGRLVAAARKPV